MPENGITTENKIVLFLRETEETVGALITDGRIYIHDTRGRKGFGPVRLEYLVL